MTNPIIQVDQIGKQYRLGAVGTGTLSHDLNRWWHRIRGKEDPYAKIEEKNDRTKASDAGYTWALKDISFEVNKGEIVGIIGQNGAGKSTLLKIISRITAPSCGEIRADGRISSLLEVGVGFHPEFTGRENIFMNGTILGMRKKEIEARLDKIVAFAGIERYVDTPVKRYSSGMYVRLAFAVAAHLEPDIMIVDEVLAVGDAEFQNKAIGKMQEVGHDEGRTVLFVSHNMEAITRICQRAIVLHQGEIYFDGPADEAVKKYADLNFSRSKISLAEREDRRGLGDYRFTKVWVEDGEGRIVEHLKTGGQYFINVQVDPTAGAGKKEVYLGLSIKDSYGSQLLSLISSMFSKKISLDGSTQLRFEIPRLPLSEDVYRCDLYMAEQRGDNKVQDWIRDVIDLKVFGNDYYNSGDPRPAGLDKFFTDFHIYRKSEKEFLKEL